AAQRQSTSAIQGPASPGRRTKDRKNERFRERTAIGACPLQIIGPNANSCTVPDGVLVVCFAGDAACFPVMVFNFRLASRDTIQVVTATNLVSSVSESI